MEEEDEMWDRPREAQSAAPRLSQGHLGDNGVQSKGTVSMINIGGKAVYFFPAWANDLDPQQKCQSVG